MAIANDGGGVGNRLNLIQLVRDDDRGDALTLEVTKQVQKVSRVLVVQCRGWLVQNQKLYLLGKCLGNFNKLLLTDTDVLDGGYWILFKTNSRH